MRRLTLAAHPRKALSQAGRLVSTLPLCREISVMPNTPTRPAVTVLLADIGGTNTRVALAHDGVVAKDTIRRFANAESHTLESILAGFLRDHGEVSCKGACIAVAGPVQDGRAEMTNLDWVITPKGVESVLGSVRIAVINDLQAQGYALDRLSPDKMHEALPGAQNPRPGPQLVVGIGTGFNAAPVHRGQTGLLAVASECGHISLPLRDAADLNLARHIEAAHGFASIEDVLSGRGLEGLYSWHGAQMAGSQATGAVDAGQIMQRIALGTDPVATATAATFVRFLGRVVGDLALVHLPFGGIYLAGGVARAFRPLLRKHGFAAAFRDKGRFSTFMDDFAVRVIEDDFAALEGCANHISGLMAR
jgi:glucokinase